MLTVEQIEAASAKRFMQFENQRARLSPEDRDETINELHDVFHEIADLQQLIVVQLKKEARGELESTYENSGSRLIARTISNMENFPSYRPSYPVRQLFRDALVGLVQDLEISLDVEPSVFRKNVRQTPDFVQR